MKIQSKKAIRSIVIFALVIFIGYNLVWYFFVHSKYDQYIGNMEVFVKNRSYVLQEDGFLYNVKYPDYLMTTGNLCVATDDDKYALLIWPGVLKDTQYAIQIIENIGDRYEISMDENKEPKDAGYKEIADTYREEIDILFEKAEEMWDIDK